MSHLQNFYLQSKNHITNEVKKKEVQRQIQQNTIRNQFQQLYFSFTHSFCFSKINPVLIDLLKEFSGAMFIFFLFSRLSLYFNLSPLHLYSFLGVFYSMQATVYKYRMNKDPNYKIPKCKCATRPSLDTQKVLGSKESIMMFNIPNSIFGTLYYLLILLLNVLNSFLLFPIALLGFLSNFYFGYVMVFNIKSLCSICINIYAINAFILYYVW
jgi:uncharacterized membrane protein